MALTVNQNFRFIQTPPQFTCPAYSLIKADLIERTSALAAPLIHIGENRIAQGEFETEFAKIFSQGDETQLIHFILENKHFNTISTLPNLLESSQSVLSPQTLRMLFRKFQPKLTSLQLYGLIRKYGIETVGPLCSRSFLPTRISSSSSGPNQSSVNDFGLLALQFMAMQNNKLRKNDFLQFWNVHKEYFKNLENLKHGFHYVTNFPIDLMKWIHDQGCRLPSDPDSIQKYMQRGDSQFIQAIAQELPPHLIQDPFSQRDLRECFEKSEPVLLDEFDFKPVAIGQAGCRTLIFTDQGDVHSFTGQDPKALLKQMPGWKNLAPFRIHLERAHASIADDDSHVGFLSNLRDLRRGSTGQGGPKRCLEIKQPYSITI